jgi:hypothetical protein
LGRKIPEQKLALNFAICLEKIYNGLKIKLSVFRCVSRFPLAYRIFVILLCAPTFVYQ